VSTSPEIIVAEMKRQVDHQIDAAAAIDTRSTAVLAAASALIALVVPHAQVDTTLRVFAGAVTFALGLATLIFLMRALSPRLEGFSYGPDGASMLTSLDDTAGHLNRDLAEVYVNVRNVNEAVLKQKGGALIVATRLIVAAVVGVGIMLLVGAIK
jgi:hypothetical protein